MMFKTSVNKDKVQPPIWYACGVAEMVYAYKGLLFTVTSLTDGHKDRPKSLHHQGLAVDIRTRHVGAQLLRTIYETIHGVLNPRGFDVVLESDHLHIEYDPKAGERWQQREAA